MTTTQQESTRFLATAQEAGTGERMSSWGETREKALLGLYGRAYGPIYGTVKVYRSTEYEGATK